MIFLSMIPIAAIRLIRDRRSSGDRTSHSSRVRAAHWIILWISILNVVFVVGTVWALKWGRPNELLDASLILKIALGLGVLTAVLTIRALAYTVLVWKNGYWDFAFRTFYTLVTIAAVAFVWFSNYWNLLGWRY